MQKAAHTVGTRGSALIMKQDGEMVSPKLTSFSFEPNKPLANNMLVTTNKTANGFASHFEPVRKLPNSDSWFENVWSEYRKRTKQA